MSADFILSELISVADEDKAKHLQRFFKTGKGEYAEGDLFLGIVVPHTRDIVKRSQPLSLSEIQILLDSPYHEARLAGLLLLVKQFKKATDSDKEAMIAFFLKNAKRCNNWDLVDLSCRDLLGAYLLDKKDRSILYKLAESDNLWEQRISIVSTWTLIKHRQFEDTLQLAVIFLSHKHDLMHKAVGWMLREIGKKDKETLISFLDKYCRQMPRTSLRYAIEHFSPEERMYYMKA
ncbi:DNA alkylation repair protein [Bacteroidales bacterium OttesenSCG-928-M11]|nr:DNA alkylation repair protein [Bacteroidales bacterium OttesenSCG-928-M11]